MAPGYELFVAAKDLQAPYDLVQEVAEVLYGEDGQGDSQDVRLERRGQAHQQLGVRVPWAPAGSPDAQGVGAGRLVRAYSHGDTGQAAYAGVGHRRWEYPSGGGLRLARH